MSGDADDTRLHALVAQARAARDELQSYRQRYRVVEAREADGAASDARVIAAAEPQREPAIPAPWQTVLLATLAGVALSTAAAAAAAAFSAEVGTGQGASRDRAGAAGGRGRRSARN